MAPKPRQKHPSTNTASFSLGKTKSGFTEKGRGFRIFLAETLGRRADDPTLLPVGFSSRLADIQPLISGFCRLASGFRPLIVTDLCDPRVQIRRLIFLLLFCS